MTQAPELRARLHLDRAASPASERAVHHLLLRLEAPEVQPAADRPTVPLDLALVLDASGSMSGEPLEFARRAAMRVAESLGPDDRLAVVSFADDVRVDLPPTLMDAAGRDRALGALAALHTRGLTNLSGGWFRGVECVGHDTGRSRRQRVVLLSDGHANRGITDPRELAEHAAQIAARGVVTSCVGVGADYSPHQLQALAEAGGGGVHHAARPEEIVEVILGELQETRAVFAEGLRLELELPRSVLAENLHGAAEGHEGDRYRFEVGPILAGHARDLVVRLLCRPGEPAGLFDDGEVRIRGRVLGRSADGQPFPPIELEPLSIARGDGSAPLDAEVARRVAPVWASDSLRKANSLRERRQTDAARTQLDTHIGEFQAYIRDLPELRHHLEELRLLRDHLDRALRPETERELSAAFYKLQKGQADHRAEAMCWSACLLDD